MTQNYVQLHAHSDYSPQDGACTVEDLAKRAAELGMPAVALTDHGRCGGLLQFKKACTKAGVKPILGCELYVAPESRLLREKVDGHNTSYHLTVLAKNDEGLKNLFRLSSTGWLDGFYYKPRVDLETLKKHKEGLVVLSGCSSGRVANRFLEDKHKESTAYAKELLKIWKDDFYIEVQNHGMDWQQPLRRWLFNLSDELSVPIVATQDSHFLNHEDAVLHQKICKLSAGDLEFGTTEMYFKSYDEMCERFDENERKALLETLDVAEKCNVRWDYGRTIWPIYPLHLHRTPESEVRLKAEDGFARLFGAGASGTYRSRLAMELDVIEKMGFATYFLVVADFIAWARGAGIPVGPGRGSGAGSLVCYCLGITEVDPIKYGLYFERFLNPARVSLPDLDIDFCPRGRKDVMSYVGDKYGNDRVAQIGTYAQFKPRGALRDFARVCGYEPTVGAKLAELIPPDIAGKALTFDEAVQAEPKLLHSQWPEVVDLARKAEGLRTKAGVHAAGVVISNDELKAQVPLFRGRGDEVATQFDMHDVEEIGLVKYDFLGLINLTIIQDTIKLVKYHRNIDINIASIPEDDQEVFANVFQLGRLDGIFQFETSSGFRDLCIRVKPTSIEDLSTITALFRPGPLCLSGDSEILTGIQVNKRGERQLQKRNLRDFYELFSSRTEGQQRQWPFWLISFDEKTQTHKKNKIKAIHASGKKPVFYVRTTTSLRHKEARARGVKASIDHQFLTLKGWKKLKDLRPGDYLCTFNENARGARESWGEVPGKKNFRDVALYNYEYRCTFCDWQEGSLDVNHVDANREKDNSPENLSFLCPNHHRMYSEGKIDRDTLLYNRDKYKLPHSRNFAWIRFDGLDNAGEEETYDIEVEGPNHNFIANSFVVHNSTGLVDKYVTGRNGGRPSYLVPELEPVLRETYGVMVYQEQIMRICTDLAGYTAAEADGMRKAIGKKLADEMASQRKEFVQGCTKNGIDEGKATQLFDDIEGFAKYSFNKTVDEDTLVDVGYKGKKIKDCLPGDIVFSLAENGQVEETTVVALHDHGIVPMWEVKFDDGTIERCTVDHKWRTSSGQIPLLQIVREGHSVWGATREVRRSLYPSKTVSTMQGSLILKRRQRRESPSLEMHRMRKNLWKQKRIDRPSSLLRPIQEGSPKRNSLEEKDRYALWANCIRAKTEARALPKLCNLSRTQKRNSSEDLSEDKAYRRKQKDIFGSSEKDCQKTRDNTSPIRYLSEMENRQSREAKKDYRASTKDYKTFKGGTVPRANLRSYRVRKKLSTSMWRRAKTSRLLEYKGTNSNRDRWALALLLNSGRETPEENPAKRQDAGSGDSTKTHLAADPSINRFVRPENRRTKILHTKLNDCDKGQHVEWSSTKRKVVRATYIGLRQGYDLEVSHPEHNYLLKSGLCCSNSHSVAYSIISYRTAWLKYYFPEEFYCSLLNNTIKEQGQLVKYIYSCKENGIAIEPPDVNRSGALFAIDNGTILFGLGGIKGIGEKTCERLLEKRGTGFRSLAHLIASGATAKDIKALALCGALEGITEYERRSIVEGVEELIKYQNKKTKWEERKGKIEQREQEIKAAIDAGHKPPKHLPKLPAPPEEPKIERSLSLSKEDKLRLEHETLGFYLTGHPLDSYPDLYRVATHNLEKVLDSGINGVPVRFPAVISVLNKKRTRKGKDMATLIVEDKSARAEVTIFPSTWNKLKDKIAEGMVAVLSCKVDREADTGEEASIVRLVLSDFVEITDPTAFEAPRMEDLKMSLLDGSTIRFIVTERTPREGWQRAVAILNNLENKR